MIWSLRLLQRRLREVSLAAICALATGCAGNHHIAPAAEAFSHPSLRVTWLTPRSPADAVVLSRWRAAVGQPLIANFAPAESPPPIDRLTIVSWNMALGEGDVAALLRTVQADHPNTQIVLLLQEAFRGRDDLPRAPVNGAFARRIRGKSTREVDDLAKALGMSLYYVPSMRNGAPALSREDRGNAILSTLPLENLAAIELPFEKQRRVALAATVRGIRSDGTRWTLRLANAHLDNTSVKKVWVGSEFARMRQARGLRDALAGMDPLVLGGDFNTWFGFLDAAYRELNAAFPGTRVTDGRRTFLGLLRLDHLFFRVPGQWRTEFKRAESSFGSDHHPLIASIAF